MKRFKTYRGLANFLYRNIHCTIDNAEELLHIVEFVRFLEDMPIKMELPLLTEAKIVRNEDYSYEITNIPKNGWTLTSKK